MIAHGVLGDEQTTGDLAGALPLGHLAEDLLLAAGQPVGGDHHPERPCSRVTGGVGLIQRIENRASGIPSLLEQARTDLASAEHERAEAEQRIGQPFRHAQALTDAEKDLARIETQLAAMQEDIDQAAQPEPAPETEPHGLNVETVRAHRPALGVRPDPERTPVASGAGSSAQGRGRESPGRRL